MGVREALERSDRIASRNNYFDEGRESLGEGLRQTLDLLK